MHLSSQASELHFSHVPSTSAMQDKLQRTLLMMLCDSKHYLLSSSDQPSCFRTCGLNQHHDWTWCLIQKSNAYECWQSFKLISSRLPCWRICLQRSQQACWRHDTCTHNTVSWQLEHRFCHYCICRSRYCACMWYYRFRLWCIQRNVDPCHCAHVLMRHSSQRPEAAGVFTVG